MYFVNSLIDLLPDELVTAFHKSDTMLNLDYMNEIMGLENDYLHSIIREGSLLPQGEKQNLQLNSTKWILKEDSNINAQ